MRKKQKRQLMVATLVTVFAVSVAAGGVVLYQAHRNSNDIPQVATPTPLPSSEPVEEPIAPPAPPAPGELGLSDNLGHLPQSVLESRLDTMKRAGVRWVRKDIEWRGAERVQGVYDWSVNDATVEAISRYGMKPLLILSYAPAWAAGSGVYDCKSVRCSIADTPEAIAAYGTFAGEAARHFCRAPYNVAGFEIWNEPNLSKYWPQPDPALYTKALKAATKAIRESGCKATIVLGGLGDTTCTGCYTSTAFLEGVYANGGAGHFDAVGSHPYTRDAPVAETWRPVALHAIMSAHGDGGKQVWATEFGYSSKALSPTQRSARMKAAAGIFRSYPWAGPMFWFGLQGDLSDIAEQPTPQPSSS